MGSTDLGVFQRASFNLQPESKSVGSDKDKQSIRCISDLVHFNAVNNPHHAFCSQSWQVPKDSASKFRYSHITYSQLAWAVERCCNWVLSNVPGASEARLEPNGSISKSAPVALFMESDVGLFIYMLSLLTLNIPCLLLSIRLSANAVRHLVKETSAASIITTSRMSSSVRNIQSECDDGNTSATALVTAAPFEEFINPEHSSSQPLQRVSTSQQLFRESDRNVFILHSSGTTGLPKAIPLAHRYLLGYAACHSFPPNEDEYSRGTNLSTLPLYHGFGALAPCLALSVGKTVCFPPASTIPTASLVVSLLEDRHITSLMTVPNIMEEITHLEDFSAVSERLASLDFVAVGGGGMKPAVAKILHESSVKLLNHFGATELGALAPIFRPQEDYDYRYLRLRTDLGLRLEFPDGDPKPGSSEPRPCKLSGRPFAWDSEFELQDALENNPLRPTLEVRILGRNDDIIVLATGEKVMPNLLEQTVEAYPDVKTAVVIGQGQFEIGLLIEPAFECSDTAEFVERIWPHIDSANIRMDRHARVSTKAAVLIKSATKEIPRTDKGSVRRREVYEVFQEEIRVLYERLDLQTEHTVETKLDFSDLRSGIRNIVRSCLPEHVQQTGFEDDDDLINLGLDSLQATRLRRQLGASLRHSRQNGHNNFDLPLDFVYSNPSIRHLITALRNPDAQRDTMSQKEQIMKDMVEKYAGVSRGLLPKKDDVVVLLTGATGSLGAHILHVLSETTLVKRIICLSRPSSSSVQSTSREILRSRQRRILEKMGLIISESGWSKIENLCWNTNAKSLGLSQSEYVELTTTITHIFHGAWPMDFKRSLSSFEPQIKAASDIVQLGRDIHHARLHCKPRIVLASSIAVVGRHNSTIVPEQVPEDPGIPLPMGYAEAKWVCEKIFEDALVSLQEEIDPMIARIGQISGSQHTGFWTAQEHIAALIKASQAIGAMPDLIGTFSWLPVDRAARVITELLLRPKPENLVFHVENPLRQPWPDTLTFFERKLWNMSLKRLPLRDWLTKAKNEEAMNQSFFEFIEEYFIHMSGGSVVLDTRNSRRMSPTLRSSGAIDKETMNLYIDYWRSINYLA